MLIRDLAPDLIFLHGQVVVNDNALPHAEALACKDGRIVAVGSDEEITPLIGEHTRVVDLAGRTLLPGIVDAHNHLLEVGLKDLFEISLEEVRSIAELVELVRQRAAETPPGQWIIGTGWNESLFAEGRLPTRHDLDAATTRHPVLLKRFFNMDVVNTVSYNPFIGLYALVTRKSWLHTPIAPDQALTRQGALVAYTRGGAWFSREEKEKGALLPGILADCIVIDRDYFSVPEEEITSIRVEMTVLHGEIVHVPGRSPGFPP